MSSSPPRRVALPRAEQRGRHRRCRHSSSQWGPPGDCECSVRQHSRHGSNACTNLVKAPFSWDGDEAEALLLPLPIGKGTLPDQNVSVSP